MGKITTDTGLLSTTSLAPEPVSPVIAGYAREVTELCYTNSVQKIEAARFIHGSWFT